MHVLLSLSFPHCSSLHPSLHSPYFFFYMVVLGTKLTTLHMLGNYSALNFISSTPKLNFDCLSLTLLGYVSHGHGDVIRA